MSTVRILLGACAALALACPPAALAVGPPDPSNCQVDHVIIASFDTRGATSGPGPCSGGTPGFDVYVRDMSNTPIANAQVTVQFMGTGTGIRPLLVQNAGATVDCSLRTITATADANGHAVMVPRFVHFSTSANPTIPVYANGHFLVNVYALSPDYDGDGQISLSDLNRFVADYYNPTPQFESDFDDCPDNRLGDFAFFAEQYLWDHGHSAEPFCN
jgi:hypothetical protein